MCGIAGFVDRGGEPRDPRAHADLVHRMCDVIRHRGPDDEGVFVADGAAIGMRRLSIIDVAGGHQPIASEDGSVWVVFNGEIYNFRELRAELLAHGHVFSTHTDTEVIVHAYEQWGEDAFNRLEGMFGIALWDRRERALLLARDPVGIKPLFYRHEGARLAFGSELKSILVDVADNRALDPAALGHYLSFLYTPADTSIFRGIRKLPPGHLLCWRDGQVRIRKYWELPLGESFKGSLDEAAERVQDVLEHAVRSHLVSDVPLGALLSGGLDSSLVVGMMAGASSRPVKTFSIGFDEPDFDELDGARRLARHFGTDHHELIVRPDALAIVERLVEHFDEPFADSSAVPTWYVFEMARRHVTVVLSGDGGDELFGGYDRYLPHPRVAAFDSRLGVAGRTAARLVGPLLPHGVTGKNFLQHVALDDSGRYVDSVSLFRPDEIDSLLTADLKRSIAAAPESFSPAARFARLAGESWPNQMMRFDLDTYLPGDILTKVDRMSMAHAIESRVPILDRSVVSVAMQLPAEMKIHMGERKRVLRRVAQHVLPREVLERRKQGFGVPIGPWFRGPLKDFMVETLQSTRARQRGYFQASFVDRLVSEHVAGRRDHALRLWQLLMFELWHRRYLDRNDERYARGSSVPLNRAEFPQKRNQGSESPSEPASARAI